MLDNLMLWGAAALVLAAAATWWFLHQTLRGKPAPLSLRAGDELPAFTAETEDGATVDSASLRGAPAVLLFIRGNWCPFCSRQVEDLTAHYKAITDQGARLVFVTPKPLDTTRRVAEMFEVSFEFWLDPKLAVARKLGLVHTAGVPGKHREGYGTDTIWPTVLVVDADGRIAWVEQSRRIMDRPDPSAIVGELEALAGG